MVLIFAETTTCRPEVPDRGHDEIRSPPGKFVARALPVISKRVLAFFCRIRVAAIQQRPEIALTAEQAAAQILRSPDVERV
jgi:hypothetical protein